MKTRDYFYSVCEHLKTLLAPSQVFTSWYVGEESDFVRFNKAAARQSGSVEQGTLNLDLIEGQRHALVSLSLSGDFKHDTERLSALVKEEQANLKNLPEDPYLLYATTPHSTEDIKSNHLPDAKKTVQDILHRASGLDFVGYYASGTTHRGFANSLGQTNWTSSHSFNLDFSAYLHGDKAVKSNYAGIHWDITQLEKQLDEVKQKQAILNQPAMELKPGKYKAYLTPTAFYDIISLLAWSGFSEKASRTKQSPLLHLSEGIDTLHPSVHFLENTAKGLGPSFQANGFIKPPQVTLIQEGRLKNCLISPRSAKEYGIQTNGASSDEMPESIEVAPGTLPNANILHELGTGLYINNLWYLNYSEKASCRMTGMTRFATFWVEDGKIKSPLNVMRFDDTVFRILGSHLLGLTQEREWIIDAHTYEHRAVSSAHLPGLLVNDFNLTL